MRLCCAQHFTGGAESFLKMFIVDASNRVKPHQPQAPQRLGWLTHRSCLTFHSGWTICATANVIYRCAFRGVCWACRENSIFVNKELWVAFTSQHAAQRMALFLFACVPQWAGGSACGGAVALASYAARRFALGVFFFVFPAPQCFELHNIKCLLWLWSGRVALWRSVKTCSLKPEQPKQIFSVFIKNSTVRKQTSTS